jgi:methionine synthase I (cobalamin-dependent)
MMGVNIKTAVSSLVAAGADAVGFNCGTTTLDEYVDLAQRYVAAAKAVNPDVLVFAEPNAGKPELLEGQAVYKVTPDEFAAAAQQIYAAGMTIIGGCCGTSPAHIEAVSKKLRS